MPSWGRGRSTKALNKGLVISKLVVATYFESLTACARLVSSLGSHGRWQCAEVNRKERLPASSRSPENVQNMISVSSYIG